MIAVYPNKECNQRYRIRPEMIGRSVKCKKCNNPFKIEELIFSPNPLEFNPIGFPHNSFSNYSGTKLFAVKVLNKHKTQKRR